MVSCEIIGMAVNDRFLLSVTGVLTSKLCIYAHTHIIKVHDGATHKNWGENSRHAKKIYVAQKK
jgi:hypothetical protein